MAEAIKALIKHLDEREIFDKHYDEAISEPVFLCSQKDKAQQVSFIVSAVKNLDKSYGIKW